MIIIAIQRIVARVNNVRILRKQIEPGTGAPKVSMDDTLLYLW